MSRIRRAAYSVVLSASFALFSFLTADIGRAQEIRRIAEPNQSIRMGRGGYVCEGQLAHSPIDDTADWTYEMVKCSGPIYGSNDYRALQAKLNHDELVKLNEALDRLNATNSATQDLLSKQVQAFNDDLRAAIDMRFQDLPHDLVQSAAIQNLKKSLIDYVDQRMPKTGANKNPTTQQTAEPANAQPGASPK
jgi:hypothetical protein